jgi:murein DD-endopeptidase MepM/ murein hydrolase activator NlpD
VADDTVTPLRPPDGQGVTVSMPFGQDGHLGEDWCTGPGDGTDKEPVYSIADGWVSVAQDFKNIWGKVVMVCYRMPSGRWPPVMEVMYAQLGTIEVEPGRFVKKGQEIGTVGTVWAGRTQLYKPHLHWEVRQAVDLGPGGGFSDHPDGWLNPSDQLAAHRGDRAKYPLLMRVLKREEQKDWGTETQ